MVRTLASDGRTVRRPWVEISHRGAAVERFDNLVFGATRETDFFATINRDSMLVAALDPDLMTDLPAPDADLVAFQDGGAQPGPARRYAGQDTPTASVLELVPTGRRRRRDTHAIERRHARRHRAPARRAAAPAGFVEQENFDNLSMEPDDPRYLPAVLAAESNLVRALDLFVRRGASHLPSASLAPQRFTGGRMPSLSAWQAAADALAAVTDVDLVLAVSGRIVVASNSDALDTLLSSGEPFQIVANLSARPDLTPERTVAFDGCTMTDKTLALAAGGHAEAVYMFTATRLREETAA